MSNGTRRVPMKIRKVKIGIRSAESAMEDFVRTAETLNRGEAVKKETGVYFTSLEAFRKALTPQRLGLLRLIRESSPASLHELARLSHRNIKNVSDDVRYLAQVGLVDLRESEKKVSARVSYDKILLEIAV
jgi:predicted transcriptional regulator